MLYKGYHYLSESFNVTPGCVARGCDLRRRSVGVGTGSWRQGMRRVELGLTCKAPIAQLAEAADLKSAKCRFESDWGHSVGAARWARDLLGLLSWPLYLGVAPAMWRVHRHGARANEERGQYPRMAHRPLPWS